MARDFHAVIFSELELQEIREILGAPKLEIFLGSDFREHLEKRGSGFSSISHTQDLGGYVFLPMTESAYADAIGLDIEIISRVTDPIVKRICKTEQEFKNAPSAAALWCAKEAAFKALRGADQPQVISEIEISEWKTNSHFETFSFFSLGVRQSGLCLRKGVYQFAIALRNSAKSKTEV